MLNQNTAHKLSWQNRLIAQDKTVHIYLIGIGGAGLSAIAKVLLELGFRVSGSDRQRSANTDLLAEIGATILTEQVAENFNKLTNHVDVALISSAIAIDHPERQAAEALGIPIVKRDQFLPILLAKRQLIAIAGTHGKSTTTSMVVKILREANIDIGYIIGTALPGYGSASAGSSPYFVLEADEYDQMFLGLEPTVSVMTNVEWDHPDCYPTAQSFADAFQQFASKEADITISCADDAGAENLRTRTNLHNPWITYSLQESEPENESAGRKTVTLLARMEEHIRGEKPRAALTFDGEPVGVLQLGVPGAHNLRNALAAISVAQWCGVSIAQACASLRTFSGTARRFEIKGTVAGITIIDDYAHHPTEVKATLSAARNQYPEQRIWAIFQPHTFSRTKELQVEMSCSFSHADQVLITDIYAAREQDTGEVNATDIVRQSGHQAIRHTPSLADTVDTLLAEVMADDVVITLGAGDSNKIGEQLLAQLQTVAE